MGSVASFLLRLATALPLSLAAAGCTAERPSEADPRPLLSTIPAPGGQWSPYRSEIADVLLPEGYGRLTKTDGVWGRDELGYGVAWRAPVRSGAEEGRCREAVRWLVGTAQQLPGDPLPGFGTTPAAEVGQKRCLRALGRFEPDAAIAITFVTSKNTRWEGLQYGAWLTFESSGPDRYLAASLVARDND